MAVGDIHDNIVEGSATVFLFDQEFGMSIEEARAVSNRYPVELTLRGANNNYTL